MTFSKAVHDLLKRARLFLPVLAVLLLARVAPAGAASFSIEEKDLFHYQAATPDPQSPCGSFASADLPKGGRLDPETGLFTWVPGFGSAGSHSVTLSCADNPSFPTQQITIDVAPATPVPIDSTTPTVTLVGAGSPPTLEQDNDQKSLETMFGVYGLKVEQVDDLAAAFAAGSVGSILVVPSYAARTLAPETVARVVSFVQQGGSILLFGKSPLSEALGIVYTGSPGTVTQFSDYLNPQLFQIWADGEPVELFRQSAGDTVFAVDRLTGDPIALGRRNGQGRILYVGTEFFDRFSAYGTKGHPYLLYHVMDHFRLKPMISAASIDAYFDPGNYDLSKVYVEDIIRGWAERGITTVYTAAWHFWINQQTGQEWTFGYDHFIEVCHLWGIKVYAWFALPHVSQKFWVTRPECREKTAGTGEQYLSWRLSVNLQNEECLASVRQFVDEVLNTHDWDGVNLAEVYYDYEQDIRYFTPMNADLRQDYAAVSGFDPIAFFDPASPHYYQADTAAWDRFLRYRTDLVTDLHRTFLDGIFQNPASAGRDIVLTAVDSLHSDYPDLRFPPGYQGGLDTGVDLPAILALAQSFDFLLQVEDPWPFWNSNPLRYRDFRATYLDRFPEFKADPSRLMFDVNVVEGAHTPSGGALPVPSFNYPTNIQTGLEFSLLLKNMFADSARLALFSENTVQAVDFDRLRWALAGDTTVSREDPATISYTAKRTSKLEGETFDRIELDGKEWPGWSAVDGSVLLPAGNHRVRLVRGEYYQGIKLAGADCLLLDAGAIPGGISAQYDSPRQKGVLTIEAFAKRDDEPFRVVVDGQPYNAEIYPFYGHYRLFLPKGRHTVQIYVMHELTPAMGQQGDLSINRGITVTFTDPVDPATLTAETLLVRDPSGTRLSGSIGYDAPTMTATFTPSAPLSCATGYTVTVTAGVKDIYGRSLAGGRDLGFTTDSYGDINNNKKVDLAAALKYLRVALGLEPQPPIDPARLIVAPVNRKTGRPQPATGRTRINLQDVVAVMERVVGLW